MRNIFIVCKHIVSIKFYKLTMDVERIRFIIIHNMELGIILLHILLLHHKVLYIQVFTNFKHIDICTGRGGGLDSQTAKQE